MASILSFLLLILSLPTFLSFADMGLVQQTCQSTNYYDLCMASFQTNPNSLQADVPGLASIITNLAMANATDTSSFLSKLANNTRDPPIKKVLGECARRYTDAGAALSGSVEEIETESYDYAMVQVMAAKEYTNSCHNLFKLKQGAGGKLIKYPAELAKREDGLVRLCDVSLAIIGLLDVN